MLLPFLACVTCRGAWARRASLGGISPAGRRNPFKACRIMLAVPAEIRTVQYRRCQTVSVKRELEDRAVNEHRLALQGSGGTFSQGLA